MTKRLEVLNGIKEHLAADGRVQLTTYTRSTVYDKRHISMFKISNGSLWVARGKHWDCIDYVSIRFIN